LLFDLTTLLIQVNAGDIQFTREQRIGSPEVVSVTLVLQVLLRCHSEFTPVTRYPRPFASGFINPANLLIQGIACLLRDLARLERQE